MTACPPCRQRGGFRARDVFPIENQNAKRLAAIGMNPLPLKRVDGTFSANPSDLHQNGFVRTDAPKRCPGENESLDIGGVLNACVSGS